jgi:hypothetical protein
MPTNDSTAEKATVPRGAARIAVDTNGHTHWFPGAAKDRRVFITDGRDVLETHDLRDLADAGALDAPTPRAWVDAFDTDAAGIATDLLAGSLFDQLADAMEAAQ